MVRLIEDVAAHVDERPARRRRARAARRAAARGLRPPRPGAPRVKRFRGRADDGGVGMARASETAVRRRRPGAARARSPTRWTAAGWSLHARVRRRGHRGVHRGARPRAAGTSSSTAARAPPRCRRARRMALVRVADPQLPFVAAVPVRALRATSPPSSAASAPTPVLAPDPARLPEVLEPDRSPAARGARRAATTPTGCCSPSRRSPTTSPPGLEPDELCARVLATLGETLGWTYGAVWRPEGDAGMLRCAALWHDPGAGPQVAAFAEVSPPHADRPRPRAARPHLRVPPPVAGSRTWAPTATCRAAATPSAPG